jgi:hypothetical protein
MKPPKMIPLADVVPYLAERHGLNVTRQTVYNWARSGRRGQFLRTTRQAGQLRTTEGWVNDFLNRVPR